MLLLAWRIYALSERLLVTCGVWLMCGGVDSNVFVYHSLNDGNLYQHDADSNESSVVMDDSIFVSVSLTRRSHHIRPI